MPRLFFTTRTKDYCGLPATRHIERAELRSLDRIVHIYRCPVLYLVEYAFFRINFELNDILLSNFNIT